MFVDFNILNQLGSPSINSNTFANRPAAGQTGRLFVSTDTFEIYRDNGTTWDLIGGPGSSTITGTGTATQVAYFTSSQAIGSSANLFWDNTNTRLGINTATPGAALDVHSTGTITQLNSTGSTNNGYLAFQRAGTTTFSIGDTYNSGSNYFRIFGNTLSADIVQIFAATGKSIFQATQTYTTGLARGNYFDYNLSVSAGGSFSSPNAITALGASLDLTLAGNATIPSGARSGLDAYNSIAFTGAGTLTHNQGSQIRAYSNLTAGWAFNGSATGTITHLAGLRALFPDNTGSAVTVTNNYALLLNDQTPNTGTVTYTNRWGVYQEGGSDLNYMAANLLLGSTINNGNKLQVTGNADFTGNVGIGTITPAAKLDVQGSSSDQIRLRTAATEYYGIGRNSSTGYLDFYGSQSGYVGYSFGGVNGTRMTLDASGNLGLGVSPSAWGLLTAMQIQGGAFISGYNNNTYVGANWYYDGSVGRYLNNDFATSYIQTDGEHQWLTASTGTAGNAISFTQAMTLGANGNLLVGTTTDAGQKLQVNGTSKFSGTSEFTGSIVTGGGSRQAITSVGAQDSSTITLSTIMPSVNFNGNFVSLTLQILSTDGGSVNSSIINCSRDSGTNWTYNLVNSNGSANTITLTFGGTSAAPTLAISGTSFSLYSVTYSVLVR